MKRFAAAANSCFRVHFLPRGLDRSWGKNVAFGVGAKIDFD